MANRLFNQFRFSLEKKVVDIFAVITFGNTGAPTLVTAKSKGVKSVTRTSQGLFVITLQDKYQRLLKMTPIFIVAAASFPAAPDVQVTADASSTTGAVTIQTNNPAGTTATDPANGEELRVNFTLSDSTAF